MSLGVLVFLLGLFGVPITLLAWGHKIRRLSPKSRRGFWGAAVGHVVAATLAVSLGMIPPEAWTAEETIRGFFGLWALLVFPVAGGIGGLLTFRDPSKGAR
jgi:hypothetical protein